MSHFVDVTGKMPITLDALKKAVAATAGCTLTKETQAQGYSRRAGYQHTIQVEGCSWHIGVMVKEDNTVALEADTWGGQGQKLREAIDKLIPAAVEQEVRRTVAGRGRTATKISSGTGMNMIGCSDPKKLKLDKAVCLFITT